LTPANIWARHGAAKQKTPEFAEYSRDWFKGNSARWAGATQERYEQILRIHLWPESLFQKPLDQIGRKELKLYLKKCACNASPATVETIHGVISGVFNEAIDDELVVGNPASGLLQSVLPPKNRRDVKPADPFNRNGLELFLSHAQKISSMAEVMMLKVMAYAGLRLGEMLAMRYEHIDLNRRTYHVVESYKRCKFGLPKKGKMRLVDLPTFLVDDLDIFCRQLKKDSLKQGKGGYIDLLFVDPTETKGWPYSQRKVQMLVKRVCRSAGLKQRNPHDLRHTYASLLLMDHMSPGYVQRQLGHSSISITMDIYCHWISGEGREGLEEALGGKKSEQDRLLKLHISAYNEKGSQ
jgi:integrase